MAVVTVAAVKDRCRELLNEVASGLYQDTPAGFIGWITEAQIAQHQAVLGALRQRGPLGDQMSHRYLRHWIRNSSSNTAADTQDYDLPIGHEETLFVLYGDPLRPAEEVSAMMDTQSALSRLTGAKPGRAVWSQMPSAQIRLYVVPGRDGVPRAVVPYQVWYLKEPTQFTALVDTLDVPHNFINGIVWYACAEAVFKERKVSQGFLQLAQTAWQTIP